MIGLLTGILVDKQPPWLWLDVSGVGYEIEAPMSTIFSLPALGESTRLFTHLSIRDDAHVLYGFATPPEKALFRELIRVNGVGPKLALGILSGISVDEFWACARAGDTAQLTRLPGIGKKTAERLLIEVRDRADQAVTGAAPTAVGATGRGNAASEAQAGLVALGYKPAEAQRLTKDADPDADAEQIIRHALKQVVRK